MTRQIERIEIRYTDGSMFEINNYELDKMEKLSEAIALIQRAQNLYSNLKTIFDKKG